MTDLQLAEDRDALAVAQAEVERLNAVVEVLMDKIERDMNTEESDFGLLRTTLALEGLVQRRTQELETALRENERIIRKLEDAHGQLLQSEKLASIGQLAAGVAHELSAQTNTEMLHAVTGGQTGFGSSDHRTRTGAARGARHGGKQEAARHLYRLGCLHAHHR